MASSGWADFEAHKNSIRHNTVAKLQTIISGWTEQCRVSIAKSGKKQDLIDRMVRTMSDWKDNNQLDKWLRAKAVLDQVRETGQYSHYAMPADSNGTFHPQPQPFASGSSRKLENGLPYPPPAGAGPSHLRYDPYAPPRKAAPAATTATATTATAAPSSSSLGKSSIRFKTSPFYRVEHPVSAVVECPESTSAMDRRSQSLSFTLTGEQIGKLQVSDSKHQLRLFCTSSLYHIHHQTGFRTEAPCPIEFPATCEVRVNNVQLTANLKGLKKKPGTAPPPDLGKAVRLTSQMPNRVDLVYVNSQQPVQHKKFYMVVYLVEVTTVEQLVEKLKKGKYKSENDVRTKMVQTASFDEDIIAGPQKMSLKCPLSYMRVNTPCRSIQCPHAQCFDATSWFSMMEQTTTWLCPVCDKLLNVEELIIDGYFDRILKDTPESVEDVVVEADGEWHTSDNKFASAVWRTLHPLCNGNKLIKSVTPHKEPEKLPSRSPSSAKVLNGRVPQEVISLTDSEDDDEGIVKRELSPTSSYATSQSQSFESARNRPGRLPPPPPPRSTSLNEVIDLTLDSDDDDPPPPPKLTHKRKDRELDIPTEASAAWKKQRLGASSASASTSDSAGYGGYTDGSRASNGVGVNGANHMYGGSGSSGTNGWGPVRTQPSAPTQSAYQAPPSHAAPSSSGMPVPSQSMNGSYSNYASPISRSLNMTMSQSPLPSISPFYGKPYSHPPGRI
ncbi:hypothetical protein K439DRAFT_1654979 [Ramaria rubella]|nr:hypothetical protein K439DRAFT_1654979 [Ramaria rubella]